MGSSSNRGSSFFLGKVTALGVLCCFALFVCLTLLASFLLPSHLSFSIYTAHTYVCTCAGASLSKYVEHLEEVKSSEYQCHESMCGLPRLWITVIIYLCSDYRFRKDEIFKRLKVTTFVQLVSWRFEVYT